MDLPKVSLPSLGGGGEKAAPAKDTSMASQEVRDEAAKEARSVFNDYDKIAKVRSFCETVVA